MTLRVAAGLAASMVAVSSAGWVIWTAAQARMTFPWAAAAIMLLPHAAALVASVLVLRAAPWWQRAGLGYLAAFTALEASGLVGIWEFASQFQTGVLWWNVITSLLALVTAALIIVTLRDMRAVESAGTVPAAFRWLGVVAGLLLVVSSTFAWFVSPNALAGRLTLTLLHGSAAIWATTILGMLVVAGITAVVAVSSSRPLVVGAAAGLLGASPLAVSVFTDPIWREADAVLAAGWWLTLAAQLLLVVVLVRLLRRGAQKVGPARVVPTSS